MIVLAPIEGGIDLVFGDEQRYRVAAERVASACREQRVFGSASPFGEQACSIATVWPVTEKSRDQTALIMPSTRAGIPYPTGYSAPHSALSGARHNGCYPDIGITPTGPLNA